MSNPFFALQQRLIDLITAAPYFAGLDPTAQLLTEKIGDLEYQVVNALLPLGFGVVVTTAEGKSSESDHAALLTDEDLNISILHSPALDSAHDALEAQWAAIQAIHGQPVSATPRAVLTERDLFRVTAHRRRLDGPAGCNVREIHVSAGMRLL